MCIASPLRSSANNSFLLDDDSSIPFNMDDITSALSESITGTMTELTPPIPEEHMVQPALAYLKDYSS